MRVRATITIITVGLLLTGLLAVLRPGQRTASLLTATASKQHQQTLVSTPVAPPPTRSRSDPHRISRRPHRLSVETIDKQDSYNNTRSFRRYIERQQRERPAFQHLPYRSDEVHIEITNITSDGRLVLDVLPLGLNVNPRHAYARFLRRYHDPGRAYLAQYGRYQP